MWSGRVNRARLLNKKGIRMALKKLSLSLPNNNAELTELKDRIEDFCQSHDFSMKDTFQITMFIEEIFVNIISYGFRDDKVHNIAIDLTYENDAITIEIEDDGVPFNPLTAEEPDLTSPVEESKVGGLGLHLIRCMCNDIQYKRTGNKNRLTIVKDLACDRHPGASCSLEK